MQLKHKLILFPIALVLFIPATCVCSATGVPERPGNYVVDLAGIIDTPAETNLNVLLRELEQKTTVQMAVLTIKSLEGQSIEEFSIAVAHDKWKLGQKGEDNGILLVVALQDRKYRIEVGYGLEGVLPDSLIGTIGRDHLVPYFRKNEYSNGISAATLAIAKVIAEARTKYFQAADVKSQIEGANRLESALSRLLLLQERYPDLKANQSFLKLQDSLEGTENRISVERKRYNEAVQNLNTYIRTIFGRFFAMLAGISQAEYYEIPEAEKEAPKVKF